MVGSAKRDPADGPNAATRNAPDEKSGLAGRTDPHLDRVIQAQIGDKLRAMYGELIDQPVPERLASILDQLSNPKSK